MLSATEGHFKQRSKAIELLPVLIMWEHLLIPKENFIFRAVWLKASGSSQPVIMSPHVTVAASLEASGLSLDGGHAVLHQHQLVKCCSGSLHPELVKIR